MLAGGRTCQMAEGQWDDRLLGLELTVLSRSLVLVTV